MLSVDDWLVLSSLTELHCQLGSFLDKQSMSDLITFLTQASRNAQRRLDIVDT